MQLIILISFNFFISFLFTFLSVPIINKIGSHHSILDEPDKRKQKIIPLVRIGGVSMIGSFVLTSLLTYFLTSTIFKGFLFNTYLFVLIVGASLYFLIGFLDDIYTITPLKRLLSQIAIATWVISQGIKVNNIFIDFSLINLNIYNIELNSYLSFFISILWIVGLVNAFNWLDGLDGLAAGSSIILAISLFMISLKNGHYDMSIFSVILMGTCLGFLFYNKYPAKIIMGDGGSNLLGFLFSTTTLIATSNGIDASNINYPLLMLIIPTGDMFFVILNRIKNGYSPFYPDRSHLHFRLIDIGFEHKQSVRQMYIFFVFTSVLSIVFQTNNLNITVIFISITLLIYNFYKNKKKYKDFFRERIK